jgi:peptidoglycan/xylan/chitin deacetylase (PgdA/CDA1 family)
VTTLLVSAGSLLYRLGLADPIIRRPHRGIRVVLYHDVGPASPHFPDGPGRPIPVDLFEAQLDFLKRNYHPITLADLEAGDVPERAVLVTFDDGFRSLLVHARGPLRARDIKPVVFLIASAVGNEELPWTHELAWAIRKDPGVARHRIRAVCADAADAPMQALLHAIWSRVPSADIQALVTRLRESLGYDPRALAQDVRLYLEWEDVLELRDEGWAFGNHTAHHYSLPQQHPRDQESEIRAGLEILRSRLGPLAAFAYPFGDRDGHSRAAALRAGHRYLMEVGGVNARPMDPTRIARVPARPTATPAELFAELEIVAPIKARVRKVVPRLRR